MVENTKPARRRSLERVFSVMDVPKRLDCLWLGGNVEFRAFGQDGRVVQIQSI